jgi:hypothetical protein
LVVQSYDQTPPKGALPTDRARPIASAQRAVTAAELRKGVHVDLLELRQDDAARGNLARALVVAWVEEGKPDLEFDGRTARPRPGSMYGLASRDDAGTSIRIAVKTRSDA